MALPPYFNLVFSRIKDVLAVEQINKNLRVMYV